jgi:hypothetical protein
VCCSRMGRDRDAWKDWFPFQPHPDVLTWPCSMDQVGDRVDAQTKSHLLAPTRHIDIEAAQQIAGGGALWVTWCRIGSLGFDCWGW